MIVIKSPTTKEDFKNYYLIRYRSLYEPWGQPRGAEKDDFEPISQHFMAVDDANGQIVGVIKLHERAPGVGQLTHLAIVEGRRGQGIGKLLIQAVEDAARKQGFSVLGVTSRLTATEYFKRHGYAVSGIPTQLFGTTQTVWMQKTLEPDV